MNDLKRLVRMALALAVLSILCIGASVFALKSIAAGQGDLTLSWSVLRVSALIILMFIALSFVTLTRVLKLPSET